MKPEEFSTYALPASQQLEAWRGWYGSVFDTSSPHADRGFAARNLTWKLDGIAVSRVSAPPLSVIRTPTLIRRDPVDHWAITLAKQSDTDIRHRDAVLRAPAGLPFVLSLGEEMYSARAHDERVQLYLARDSFGAIAATLDAARATVLNTPSGKLLADYMLLLDRNLPELDGDDAARLPGAIQAMVAACLAPTADRIASAGSHIRVTLMERVRQAVRRNLRSPSLGPDKLCREAATSRSQLYRLLENEGGVKSYIQRRRLVESFSMLCDVANNLSIGRVAELLCFADASTFSRAFRREFGMSPSDVRAAAFAGLAPVPLQRKTDETHAASFGNSLRA